MLPAPIRKAQGNDAVVELPLLEHSEAVYARTQRTRSRVSQGHKASRSHPASFVSQLDLCEFPAPDASFLAQGDSSLEITPLYSILSPSLLQLYSIPIHSSGESVGRQKEVEE